MWPEDISEYGVGCWPLKTRPHVSGPYHALNRWGEPICGRRSPINQNITLLLETGVEEVSCSFCQKADYRIYKARMKYIESQPRPWYLPRKKQKGSSRV